MRVTAKERDQIVTAYTTVQKKHPSWRMVVVSSRGFAEDSRKTLETNGIECKTYQDLLRELLPLENYIRGQVSDYENWFNDKEKGWGGRDLFIRPDVRRESTNEEKKALDLFAEWIADSNQNHLTILGDLGTGKSTLTRFLAYQMGLAFLEDQARHPAPVFIPLREAKRAAFDLETIIISHFNKNGIPDVKFSNFEHLLNSGKIILFFDAFDEMADRIRWEETRQNFQELNRAISKNDKVILTCRTHYFKSREEQIEILGKGPGYSEAVTELYKDLAGQPGRTIVDLCEFTDDQIKEYVKKARPETFQEDIKKIEDIYDLHELAHRPLLLDMIVKSLHKIGEDSKINAADLYTVYTDIWIQREELKHPTLKPDVKLNLMLELAWRMWDLERSEISIDEMIPLVEDLLRKGFIDIVDEEARDIVREMHTATFLRRGKNDAFIFVHRSFMEYFLARKICQTLGVINESGNALKENIQQTDESLKILKTNRLEQKIVYFIAHLAKNDLLKEPLNEILTNAYREKISENALQILCWTGRVRCKAEKRIPESAQLP